MGCSEEGWRNSRLYCPPVRISMSQDSRERPHDFGTHHCRNSSGLVQASNTMRAGAANCWVATKSRSELASTTVLRDLSRFARTCLAKLSKMACQPPRCCSIECDILLCNVTPAANTWATG